MGLSRAIGSSVQVLTGVGLLWYGGGPWVAGGTFLLVWGNNNGH